jgi:hypothetical protein
MAQQPQDGHTPENWDVHKACTFAHCCNLLMQHAKRAVHHAAVNASPLSLLAFAKGNLHDVQRALERLRGSSGQKRLDGNLTQLDVVAGCNTRTADNK